VFYGLVPARDLIAFKNGSIISTVTQDDGLLSNNINLLTAGEDGSIYIGTNNGLNRYFPESKRIFSYTERNGFTGIEAKPNAVFKVPQETFGLAPRMAQHILIPQKQLHRVSNR
jgi:ligand-binding sensor domain-containing protein